MSEACLGDGQEIAGVELCRYLQRKSAEAQLGSFLSGDGNLDDLRKR